MKDTDNSLSRSNYDILLVNIFKNFVLRNNFSKLFFLSVTQRITLEEKKI